MVKQVIAIAGMNGRLAGEVARKFAAQNRFRLLLITDEDPDEQSAPMDFPDSANTEDLERLSCLKEGCWEADIILLDKPFHAAEAVAGRIKEVATQKIVFIFSGTETDRITACAHGRHWQHLLPDAKVVSGFQEAGRSEIFFSGKDQEALQRMAGLMRGLDYQIVFSEKN